jgi:hypothetical protein
MGNKRVKYFGLSDLAANYYIEKARDVITNLEKQIALTNINDAIELFVIDKYIKTNIDFGFQKNTSTVIKYLLGDYLKQAKKLSLAILYNDVEKDYINEFWEFFAKYKLYNYFDNNQFSDFLKTEKPNVQSIILNEKLVSVYDECIGNHLIDDSYSAVLLLEVYETENYFKQNKMFIPKSLTLELKERIIIQYIKSDNPSINILRLVTNIVNRDEIRISDKTRLLAKRRFETETDIFFQKNSGQKFGVSINYSPTQEETCVFNQNEGITELTYNYRWIKENLDYNTLFNNFIYLFEYFDEQGRITLTSKECEIGAIERSFTTWAKNDYPISWSFQQKERVADLQLYSYIDLLKSFEVKIEEMIKWFFNDYLINEFSITDFIVNIPSENTTYFEKCRILAPEIESICKKYNMLVEDDCIDSELLEISSTPLSFSCCKSMFPVKYIYPNSKDFHNVCYLFFSDQSMLNYIEREEKSYNSFFDVIKTRKVKINDYQEYQHNNINWLIDNDYLTLDEDENIIFKDNRLIWVLRELYKNETINYVNCPTNIRLYIDTLLNDSYVRSESTFFSESEQNYFNYYLNRSKYGNSLDIRNSYVHGTQPRADINQQIHKHHYIVILKLLILIVLKINDEVCNIKNLTTAST